MTSKMRLRIFVQLASALVICFALTIAPAQARWNIHDGGLTVTRITIPPGGSDLQTCSDRLEGDTGWHFQLDPRNLDPTTARAPDDAYEAVDYALYRVPPGTRLSMLDDGTVVSRDEAGATQPAPLVKAFTTPEREQVTHWISTDDGPTDSHYLLTIAHFTEELDNVQPGDVLSLWLADSRPPTTAVTMRAIQCDRSAPQTRLTSGPVNGSWVLSRSATFDYTSEVGADFECRIDNAARACDWPPFVLDGLSMATHVFSVAARDQAGNVDPTPERRAWTVPLDAASLEHDGRWQLRSDAAAYGGAQLATSSLGATITRRVTGARKLALVASKGRGHGTVQVFAGQTLLRTISLAAPSARTKQVIPVASFDAPRTARIRIVVSSRGKPVRIEGLGVATR